MELMFNRIVNSNAIIKLQDRDEKDFNEKQYLDQLFKDNKKKFLERFFQYLTPDDAFLFEVENGDKDKLIIDYYLKKICESMGKKSAKVKNRRYEALQRLIKQGEYFDDESMKSREPLLYEEMIGKYEQSNAQSSSSSSGLHLTDFLMKHLENLNHGDRLNQLKSIENEQIEEEEEEEEEEEDDENHEEELRNEFLTIMHRKFLNGEDKNFDYRSIDYNDDYDNIEIESRDLEEKYFDDDDE